MTHSVITNNGTKITSTTVDLTLHINEGMQNLSTHEHTYPSHLTSHTNNYKA